MKKYSVLLIQFLLVFFYASGALGYATLENIGDGTAAPFKVESVKINGNFDVIADNLADLNEKGLYSIDTIQALRDYTGPQKNIFLRGHTTVGDGGGGVFGYVSGVSPGTYVDDNGTIALPAGGDGGAAWIRQYSDYINVRWFGAHPDASASINSTAINAAITVAKPSRSDVVALGTYHIDSTIMLVDAPGVSLIGGGGSGYTNVQSTLFVWDGGATDVIFIGSSQTAANKSTSGGVQGIGINANGVATNGIHATSINNHFINDVAILNTVENGLLMDCLSDKLNSGAGGPADNQGNTVSNLSVKTTVGNAVMLSGNDGNAISGANTSLNYFENIHLDIRDNNGFIFEYADGNTLSLLRVYRPSGNSGIGLIFEGDDSGGTRHSRHNVCYNVQTAFSGVLAKGGVKPSEDNTILGLNIGNSAVNNLPIIESGARLSYISQQLISGLGGSLLAVSGATDTARHVNVGTQLPLMGTASLRVHNGSNNHATFVDNSSNIWGINIGSTGNFKLARYGGNGAVEAGSIVNKKEVVSASTKILDTTSSILLIDATANNRTVELPAANAYGSTVSPRIIVRRIDSSGYTVTVRTGGSDTLDGTTSLLLAVGEGKTFVSDGGTAWYSL